VLPQALNLHNGFVKGLVELVFFPVVCEHIFSSMYGLPDEGCCGVYHGFSSIVYIKTMVFAPKYQGAR
jgi:hypothetical protein